MLRKASDTNLPSQKNHDESKMFKKKFAIIFPTKVKMIAYTKHRSNNIVFLTFILLLFCASFPNKSSSVPMIF